MVKKELSRKKAKLSIYQSIYAPTLTYGPGVDPYHAGETMSLGWPGKRLGVPPEELEEVSGLVEVRGKPRMKISEDPEKSTVPGRKAVYRLIDADGHPFLDLVCLAVESPPEAGVSLSCYPLGCDNSSVSVTPAQVTCLRQEVFTKGQLGDLWLMIPLDLLTRSVNCDQSCRKAKPPAPSSLRSCRSPGDPRGSLCSLPPLLLRLSAATLPPLPSSSLTSTTAQKGRKEKKLIKLFRSASPNFLCRPLELELSRAGRERSGQQRNRAKHRAAPQARTPLHGSPARLTAQDNAPSRRRGVPGEEDCVRRRGSRAEWFG
ncbi:hypothetical protein L3Q82_007850 [Scortum barcoo]|uniref:Uncharacterized protein n=1 Tax=Scortum barcoo TaxID=214431 RepID=A0ACB8WJX6_9TELE|nr:hypothetical protein L3Q82_007850 [Scortum barcoo]